MQDWYKPLGDVARDEVRTDENTYNQTVTNEDCAVEENADTHPRVTENAPEDAQINDCDPVENAKCDARVLTIPGAVYRIPTTEVEPVAQPVPFAEPAISTDVYESAMTDVSYPVAVDLPEEHTSSPAPEFEVTYNVSEADTYTAPMEYVDHEPVSDEQHPIAIPYDSSQEEEEYKRFLAENDQKEPQAPENKPDLQDTDLENFDLAVDSVDKCVKLVESRMRYEIETMKAEHKMMRYTFSADVLKKDRTERKLRRNINDRMCKLSRALKRERADSTRYYTAVMDKYAGSEEKRSANASRIESLIDRLDCALKEREQIDEKLMRLYTNGDGSTSSSKENKVAERAAKNAYKSHIKAAKRVARMHAPEELKEKIFTLMNEHVAMLSAIEKNRYLLAKKRYTGADKRDVKRQNREMKRAARQKEDDIIHFIKKAEKYDAEHGNGVKQIGWLVLTVILLGAVGIFYLVAKYVWGWF